MQRGIRRHLFRLYRLLRCLHNDTAKVIQTVLRLLALLLILTVDIVIVVDGLLVLGGLLNEGRGVAIQLSRGRRRYGLVVLLIC